MAGPIKPFQEKSHLRQSPSVNFSGVEAQSRLFRQIADETSSIANQLFNDAAATAKKEGSTSGSNAMSMNPDGTIMRHSVPEAGTIFTENFKAAQTQAVQAATVNSFNQKQKDLLLKLAHDPDRLDKFDKEMASMTDLFVNTSSPDIRASIATEGQLLGNQGRRSLLQINIKEQREQQQNDVVQKIIRLSTEIQSAAENNAGFDITQDDVNLAEYSHPNVELAFKLKDATDTIINAQKSGILSPSKASLYLQKIREGFVLGYAGSFYQNERRLTPSVIERLENDRRSTGEWSDPSGIMEDINVGKQALKSIIDSVEQQISKRQTVDLAEIRSNKLNLTARLQAFENKVKNHTTKNGPLSEATIFNLALAEGLDMGHPDVIQFIDNKLIRPNFEKAKTNLETTYETNLQEIIAFDKTNKSIDGLLDFIRKLDRRQFPKIYKTAVKALDTQSVAIKKEADQLSVSDGNKWLIEGIKDGTVSREWFEAWIKRAEVTGERNPFINDVIKRYKSWQTYIKKIEDADLGGFTRKDEKNLQRKLNNRDQYGPLNKNDLEKFVNMDKHYNKNKDISLNTPDGVAYNLGLMSTHNAITPAYEALIKNAFASGNPASLAKIAQINHQFSQMQKENGSLITSVVPAKHAQFVSELQNYLINSEDGKPFERNEKDIQQWVAKWREKENANSLNTSGGQSINVAQNETKNMVQAFRKKFLDATGDTDQLNRRLEDSTHPVYPGSEITNDPFIGAQPSNIFSWSGNTTIDIDRTALTYLAKKSQKIKNLDRIVDENALLDETLRHALGTGDLSASILAPKATSKGHENETEIKRDSALGLTRFACERNSNPAIADNCSPIAQSWLTLNWDQEKARHATQNKNQKMIDVFGTPKQIVEEGRFWAYPQEDGTYKVVLNPKDPEENNKFMMSFDFNLEKAAIPVLERLGESASKTMRDAENPLWRSFGGEIASGVEGGLNWLNRTKQSVDMRVLNQVSKIPFVGEFDYTEEKNILAGEPNKQTLDLLMTQEGYRERVYPDGGNFAIGHGANLKYLEPDEKIFLLKATGSTNLDNLKKPLSKEDSKTLLNMRVNRIVSQFDSRQNKSFNFDKLGRGQRSALVSMVFQNGWTGFRKMFSKAIPFIKKGNFEKAAQEIGKTSWAKKYKTRAKQNMNLLRGGDG